MVEQLLEQPVERVAEGRSDWDLGEEAWPQRLDPVLDSVGGVDRLGRGAFDAIGLSNRGSNALLQRGALIGEQPACLYPVGLVEMLGERVEAVAAQDVGDDAYRALGGDERLAIANSCRDRAAEEARGVAADQLRDVDPRALRAQLDDAFSYFAARRRSVAELCRERLPFVTSGLRVTFAGAKPFGDDAFTYETRSDKLLTMRGTVSPAPIRGRVVVRREGEASIVYHTHISADGRFVIPALRLRKQADNTFILTINGPPNAPRKVYFSALCLDCLAGAPPPSTQQ
jgi:hypothetical protein